MNERVTIQDVARAAGVSKATVSRVLNDKPDVDEATRQRVLAAIGSLGYIPNQAALTLARRTPGPQATALSHAQLPAGFLWGTATSAYQIEGATREDGRGPSIWDEFVALPGATFQGQSGEPACDSYHRWPEDVALLDELGLNAYRFSLSWSRILPEGTGIVNEPGLDFYDRFTDALLERHITPVVTLYHWDLPAALQRQGGWLNRSTAEAFAEYTRLVVRRLGDRVRWWVTLNEPWCSAYFGYETGTQAPGLQEPGASVTAGHNLLLAHALGMAAIRAESSIPSKVGITLNLTPVYALDQEPETLQRLNQADTFHNRWYLDPLFRGSYPAGLFEQLGATPPPEAARDMPLIAAPLDFLGVNYYTRLVFQTRTQRAAHDAAARTEVVVPVPGASYTHMGWEIYPQGLHDILLQVHLTYRPPALFVTELGAAFEDDASASYQVRDDRRIAYLREHLDALMETVGRGVPVQGCFIWTLLDNFEWADGYSKRFGLVAVDPATQARRIKASGRWYAEFVRTHYNTQSAADRSA
jgi:beta-glucosidase